MKNEIIVDLEQKKRLKSLSPSPDDYKTMTQEQLLAGMYGKGFYDKDLTGTSPVNAIKELEESNDFTKDFFARWRNKKGIPLRESMVSQ